MSRNLTLSRNASNRSEVSYIGTEDDGETTRQDADESGPFNGLANSGILVRSRYSTTLNCQLNSEQLNVLIPVVGNEEDTLRVPLRVVAVSDSRPFGEDFKSSAVVFLS